MAIQKDVYYGEQLTTYHILAAVWVDYKAENGGNVVGLVQSYIDLSDREQHLYTTSYRQTIPLAGHMTETNFFLALENESTLKKCYDVLKTTPLFVGAIDC